VNPESRRQQIVTLLNKADQGHATIPDLSRALCVSEMTIRRDLEYLERQEQLRRVYGGAIALKGMVEQPYTERAEQSSPQKISIGKLAASLASDGQSVWLDSGTTTRQVAHNLINKEGLTVVTNNLPIAEELGQIPHIKTFILGGLIKQRELCTVGFSARRALESFTVDIAFLGAAGFSVRNGITDIDINEVEIKQTGIRIANEVILVADSNKFNTTAILRVAPLSAARIIVTDDDLPEHAIREIEAEGIEIITPARLRTL
jgi:DeoR/GlpR family transcriptional regulator of sugar metabolism